MRKPCGRTRHSLRDQMPRHGDHQTIKQLMVTDPDFSKTSYLIDTNLEVSAQCTTIAAGFASFDAHPRERTLAAVAFFPLSTLSADVLAAREALRVSNVAFVLSHNLHWPPALPYLIRFLNRDYKL
ncbi:hypothetical protein BC938DRAFT_475949 [Jimgerdemannia flammicorona]|uniref:Uncharacterized protein n=1 Tax=Jimgerdemannia flammicorona TaxID=994334 RepID=A0A433QR64_9FUNG|nr:hypothetical protein BC938DRAFT_475949 [Jimgerdemannia flammicorona]